MQILNSGVSLSVKGLYGSGATAFYWSWGASQYYSTTDIPHVKNKNYFPVTVVPNDPLITSIQVVFYFNVGEGYAPGGAYYWLSECSGSASVNGISFSKSLMGGTKNLLYSQTIYITGAALADLLGKVIPASGEALMGAYIVTADAHSVSITGENTSITPKPGALYMPGDSVTVEPNINEGYIATAAVIDGVDCLEQILEGSYTFTMPDRDVTGTITAVPIPQYTVTASYVGTGSVTGLGGYNQGDTVTVNVVEGSHQLYSWEKDGVKNLVSPGETSFYFVMPASDVALVITFVETHIISASEETQTTDCKMSPYANLGYGNVLIQPHANIYAAGSFLSGGGSTSVSTGELVSWSVSTESIYTRLVSCVVNGVEQVQPGENTVNKFGTFTAESNVTISAVVCADRFCYMQSGNPDIPGIPVVPPAIPGTTLIKTTPTTEPSPTSGPTTTPTPPAVPPVPTTPPGTGPGYPPVPYPPGGGGGGEPVPGATAPIAEANGPYIQQFGVAVQFDSTGTHDTNDPAQELAYLWDFGDGETSDLPNPAHQYKTIGDYVALLSVTNESGLSARDNAAVRIWSVPVIRDRPEYPDYAYIPGLPQYLILRWNTDGGKVTREKLIPLDTRSPVEHMHRLGIYRSRQWQILMEALIPCVVVYLEEDMEVLDAL